MHIQEPSLKPCSWFRGKFTRCEGIKHPSCPVILCYVKQMQIIYHINMLICKNCKQTCVGEFNVKRNKKWNLLDNNVNVKKAWK